MSQFAEYTRSAAFRIDLSKAMIGALLSKVDGNPIELLSVGNYQALQRRGLVDWHKDMHGKRNGLYVTEAGYAVANLLRLAGYGNQSSESAA